MQPRPEPFIEGCISLYFGGRGQDFVGFEGERPVYRTKEGWAEAIREYRADQARTRKKLAEFNFEPGIVYNVALAGGQHHIFEPPLLEAGFKLAAVSTNPNTQRRIRLYIREPQ